MNDVSVTERPWLKRIPERYGQHKGYAAVATEISCIPDAVYPFDPDVLRAIHVFDPRVIPLWVRRVYRHSTTGGILVLGRHAIASHVWNPHASIDRNVYRALMPTYRASERPTQVDFHHLGPRAGQGLCGPYLPFDGYVSWILRRTYDTWTAKERQAYIETHGEEARATKAKASAEAESEYIAKTDGPWLQKHIEQFDDQDARRIAAGPQPHEAKPFVEVGRQEEAAS